MLEIKDAMSRFKNNVVICSKLMCLLLPSEFLLWFSFFFLFFSLSSRSLHFLRRRPLVHLQTLMKLHSVKKKKVRRIAENRARARARERMSSEISLLFLARSFLELWAYSICHSSMRSVTDDVVKKKRNARVISVASMHHPTTYQTFFSFSHRWNIYIWKKNERKKQRGCPWFTSCGFLSTITIIR